MSDDLEDGLRAVLRATLDPLQPAPGLASGAARRGRSLRRRSRLVTAGAAVGAVLVALGVAVVVQGVSGDDTLRPAATASAQPTLPPPPAGQQAVSFHGIQLFVPDDWQVPGGVSCTGGTRPGVSFPGGAVPACGMPPSQVPEVQLARASSDAGEQYAALATEPALVDGQPVRRGRGSVLPGSPVVEVMYVPQTEAVVVVKNPDRVEFDVLTTVHFAPVDRVGCQDRLSGFAPGPTAHPQAKDRLLPEQPTRVAVCRYLDGWLMQSRAPTASELAALMADVEHAPAAPQRWSNARCDEPQTEGIIVRAEYAQADPVVLSARLDGCPWQVTNGQLTRGLSLELLDNLTDAVGYAGSLGNVSELPAR